jgi:hypothetical protein
MALCKQADAARIILIRAAPFNHDSTEEIKQKLSSYIVLFKFKDCVNESIPVMLMSDENEQMEIIFENDNLIVRDVVENESKNTLRQLIFRSSPTEIQSEVYFLFFFFLFFLNFLVIKIYVLKKNNLLY